MFVFYTILKIYIFLKNNNEQLISHYVPLCINQIELILNNALPKVSLRFYRVPNLIDRTTLCI